LGIEKIALKIGPEWLDALDTGTASSRTLVSRACVRDSYDEILRRMGIEGLPPPCTVPSGVPQPPLANPPPLHRAVVVGNPGIGKSYGLLHALRRLLIAGKVVTFDFAKEGLLYAFIPSRMEAEVVQRDDDTDKEATRQVWRGSGLGHGVLEDYKVYVSEYSLDRPKPPILRCPDAFCLLDPHEEKGFPLLRARTIVATSPDEEKMKVYLKEEYFCPFYVPMFTLDEMKRVLKANALGEVNEAVVEDCFRVVGGNLRAIRSIVESPWILEAVKKKILAKVNLAPTSEYFIMACAQNSLIPVDKTDDCSSTLFSYESKYPFLLSSARVGFVSDYIRAKLGERFYNDIYRRGLYDSDIWEVVCAVALGLGGKFQVLPMPYKLGKGEKTPSEPSSTDTEAPGELELPTCGPSSKYSFLELLWRDLPREQEALAAASTARLYESVKGTFALVDFVLYRDVVFNATLNEGDKKLPSMATIKKILKNVGASKEKPLRLYHCVSQEQFEGEKSIKTAFEPEKLTANNRAFLRDHIQQYLLRIPMSHPKLK
jgi:hypothetical protein